MVKKYWYILLLFLFVCSIPVSAAAGEIEVVVDGEIMEFEHPPVLEHGRMLLPMRELFTAVGADVYWDDAGRTSLAVVDNVRVSIPIGSYLPTVDDVPVSIDVPAMLIGGRTYIPLRFAVESLGGDVNWEADRGTVFITTASAAAGGNGEDQDCDLFELLLDNIEIVHREEGVACWYGDKFHGRMTSSGEVYDKNLHTAAHRILPFGTMVKVKFPETGQSVWVRINDRGPHVPGRIIDLSHSAADAIGLTRYGIGWVELEVAEER